MSILPGFPGYLLDALSGVRFRVVIAACRRTSDRHPPDRLLARHISDIDRAHDDAVNTEAYLRQHRDTLQLLQLKPHSCLHEMRARDCTLCAVFLSGGLHPYYASYEKLARLGGLENFWHNLPERSTYYPPPQTVQAYERAFRQLGGSRP